MSFFQGTKQEWQKVFYIASGMFIFGGFIFLVFSKGTVVSWADNSTKVDDVTNFASTDGFPTAATRKQFANATSAADAFTINSVSPRVNAAPFSSRETVYSKAITAFHLTRNGLEQLNRIAGRYRSRVHPEKSRVTLNANTL
jgi:hypothetical protein